MSKKCTQIALGGMFSALCVTLMFMTGIIPFATYAIPMLAGAMLIPVMAELGAGSAMMVYASVSLVSVFVVADKEAAMMFIAFFGYYPVLRPVLERIPPAALRWLCKLLVFNASVVAGFWVTVHAFGMAELLEGMGDFGRYTPLVLLAAGNVIFLIYDFTLARFHLVYTRWFKPKFLRR